MLRCIMRAMRFMRGRREGGGEGVREGHEVLLERSETRPLARSQ